MERITALAEPVQSVFFVRRWHVLGIVRGFGEFDRALAALDEDLPGDQAASASADAQ